jgi:hypothetical protein
MHGELQALVDTAFVNNSAVASGDGTSSATGGGAYVQQIATAVRGNSYFEVRYAPRMDGMMMMMMMMMVMMMMMMIMIMMR